jgi:ribosomal protein S18 acetylase RimI-like enzyme
VDLIQKGKMRGYLAYLDGEPIGWCNANDKVNYPRLVSNKDLWDGKEEKICSIVCFIIAPEHRRKGIASQILDVICRDFSKRGYEYVEAYPRKGELTCAEHYHGPLSMYVNAGFTLYKSFGSYDIVRKKL